LSAPSAYESWLKIAPTTNPFYTVPMLQIQHTADDGIEVGIDEAGRGCFWGSLYAGAVIWVPEAEMSEEQAAIAAQIKDSKKLSEKRRNVLSDAIKDLALAWGIGSVTAEEIDTLGMTKANQLAFTRALETLEIMPDRLIIDGTLSIYDQPWSMIEQVVEPEADGKYVSVAAASILAKVAHDDWVHDYAAGNATVA
jgi:ribonuclease HII